MSKCIWIYKGIKEFNSEIELDEFLLRNNKAIEKEGDIVFSRSSQQQERLNKFDSLETEVQELFAKGKLSGNTVPNSFNDIDGLSTSTPDYLSLSNLIKIIDDAEGTKSGRLTPIFNEENYFKGSGEKTKFKVWQAANTLEEIPEEDREVLFEKNASGEYIFKKPTLEMCEAARVKLLNKWEFLRIQGNILHEIMRIYFKGNRDHHSLFDSFYSFEKKKEKILKELRRVKIIEGGPSMADSINSKVLDDMIKICIEFGQSLKENPKFKDAIFLPEINIKGTGVNADGFATPVVGRLDLAIIDKFGNVHVIDYKASPKEYNYFNPAKKLTFTYQQAFYRQVLQQNGINLGANGSYYIMPLVMDGLHITDDENWEYDTVSTESDFIIDLKPEFSPNVNKNVRKYIPVQKSIDATSENIGEFVYQQMNKWFKDKTHGKEYTNEDAILFIKRQNGFKKQTNNKYQVYIGKNVIQSDTEDGLITKVKNELQSRRNNITDLTQLVKSDLITAQEKNVGEFFEFSGKVYGKGDDARWIHNKLKKFASIEYQVLNETNVENYPAILDELGIVLIQHKLTKAIHVIKLTNEDPRKLIALGVSTEDELNKQGKSTNTTLVGFFEEDSVAKSRPQELVLNSYRGNIELMEAMLAINCLPNLFTENASVASIEVVCPSFNSGITATNKQLLYNFNELCKLSGTKDTNISAYNNDEKPINFLTQVELIKEQFNRIQQNPLDNKLKFFRRAVSDIDSVLGNHIALRHKLISLKEDLEKYYPELKGGSQNTNTSQLELYKKILYTIAELDGYDFKQQIINHDNYLDEVRQLQISGLEIDNPGNLTNETLNTLTKAVSNAYQNIRDDMQRDYQKIMELGEKLKESKNLSYVETHITGTSLDYFKNLTEIKDNDLMFVDPEDMTNGLSNEEREYLKYALLFINSKRYPGQTREMIGDYHYLRVPLTRGKSNSERLTNGGWFNTLTTKLKLLSIDELKKGTIFSRFKNKAGVLITPQTQQNINYADDRLDQWEMINEFDAGEDDDIRNKMLNEIKDDDVNYSGTGGIARFERNVETLLLKYSFAYSSKEHLDEIFPTLKAAMFSIVDCGIEINEKLSNDLIYLHKYIKNKVFNQSIVKPQHQAIHEAIKELQGVTSKLALGLSPHQLYQVLDGIWKDASLIFKKPDGNMSFTKENMTDSFFDVYKDIAQKKSRSVIALLNQQYGINDMDMNVYVDRINPTTGSLDDILFKFASRPDYYNRMTMFTAQMRGDGCYKAHKIGKNNQLIYDMSLDERFDVLVKNDQSNLNKYNKQKALYIAMAQQFMQERVKNSNGTLFEFDIHNFDPNHIISLPRAYTNQQAESMKALSDKIYGYYSSEKKSLCQSGLIGGLLLQMNTYWSSKKNQYLGRSAINLQGHMEHFEAPKRNQDGEIVKDGQGNPIMEKYYHKIDESGNPTREIVTEDQLNENDPRLPYMVWKGQFEEGILVTLAKIANTIMFGNAEGQKGWNAAYDEFWNAEDENLRRCYRSNLKQFFMDMIMAFIIGSLINYILVPETNKNCKERGNDTFGDAVTNMVLHESVSMLNSSFEDFNPFTSIGGRGVQWTPFSIQTMTRQWNNWSGLFGGKDLFDCLVKTSAATRFAEPILDQVKLGIYDRHIGEKAKE